MRIKLGIIALLLIACSASAARDLFAPVAAQAQEVRSNALMLQEETPTPTETLADIPTDTETPIVPTDTDTPTLTPETPTQGPPPVFEAWTGNPTYPESLPGYLFLVQYDTALWARGDESRQEPSLVSKRINNCVITQAVGRGQPPGWIVDDDSFQTIGEMRYEVVRVSRGGTLQFVNYFGGDGNVFTGFRVEFQYAIEDCLHDVEAVFATLTSVLAPTPMPTFTPEPPMILPTDTPTETPAEVTVTPTP
jgi:hypothetical protein